MAFSPIMRAALAEDRSVLPYEVCVLLRADNNLIKRFDEPVNVLDSFSSDLLS